MRLKKRHLAVREVGWIKKHLNQCRESRKTEALFFLRSRITHTRSSRLYQGCFPVRRSDWSGWCWRFSSWQTLLFWDSRSTRTIGKLVCFVLSRIIWLRVISFSIDLTISGSARRVKLETRLEVKWGSQGRRSNHVNSMLVFLLFLSDILHEIHSYLWSLLSHCYVRVQLSFPLKMCFIRFKNYFVENERNLKNPQLNFIWNFAWSLGPSAIIESYLKRVVYSP